jgi:hypothetical protein
MKLGSTISSHRYATAATNAANKLPGKGFSTVRILLTGCTEVNPHGLSGCVVMGRDLWRIVPVLGAIEAHSAES